MISMEHVTKSYAKSTVKAVDDIQLHVKHGEVFGFIGPNGAGKTTTIKMLTGILPPDQGQIKINGFDIQTQPVEAKRCFGYAPDSHQVYDRLTGLEYLNFIGDMYGVAKADRQRQIEKYLTMFDLIKAAGSQIKSYSHGMRQKLALTGALLPDPQLWIMDEPMVGLDPKSAHLLKQEMRAHCQRGRKIVRQDCDYQPRQDRGGGHVGRIAPGQGRIVGNAVFGTDRCGRSADGMNQFWRLTRLQLKLTFGLASLKAQIKSGGKERLKAIASLVMIVLLCGGLLTGYLWLLNWLFDLVVLNTIQDTLLAMSIIAGMLVVFVFGIPYAFSLYYAKDIPFLASMPIKQSTVFASKFVSSLIGELGTFSLLVVPTFIIYATHMQVTAQYIFSAGKPGGGAADAFDDFHPAPG